MPWETKEQATIPLNSQRRLVVSYERIDFFFDEERDCEKDSRKFAQTLFEFLGDHLTRRNLQDIIDECEKRLEEW